MDEQNEIHKLLWTLPKDIRDIIQMKIQKEQRELYSNKNKNINREFKQVLTNPLTWIPWVPVYKSILKGHTKFNILPMLRDLKNNDINVCVYLGLLPGEKFDYDFPCYSSK